MFLSHDRSVPQRRMRQWQMANEGSPAKCQSRNQRLPHLKVAHELPARPMEVPQMTWQLESRQRFVRSLWMTKSSISPGTRRSQRSRTWIPGVQNTVWDDISFQPWMHSTPRAENWICEAVRLVHALQRSGDANAWKADPWKSTFAADVRSNCSHGSELPQNREQQRVQGMHVLYRVQRLR